MSGILSATPGQGAIRLLVGSHGLLLVQSILSLWTGPNDAGGRLLAIVAIGIAVPALLCALIGDDVDHDHPWRSRHDR